uniref:Uncharacterized protein n=1 Tax=Eptatretus burgeri TaxID=7764 RepID=A0A8C4QXJ0_EPTBU
MAAHKPVEWVNAVIQRFDEQLPMRTGQVSGHSKVGLEHSKECLVIISQHKFSLVASGLTTILKTVNHAGKRTQGGGAEWERNLQLSQLSILDTLEKCLAGQPREPSRLDESTLVKQLLPEICHFLHLPREGGVGGGGGVGSCGAQGGPLGLGVSFYPQLRASASRVMFSLSCNHFGVIFNRISTR